MGNFKDMAQSLIILFFLFIQINLFAQTVKHSDSLATEFYRKVKEQDSKILESERIRDSLRIEFFKQPAIIYLSFEKNIEKISLDNNYEFWLENDNKRYNPRLYRPNQFLADSISDKITLIFKYDHDTLRFSNLGYGWIKNGAQLRFGIIDNLEGIRGFYNKLAQDEDFNEYTDIGQPYLGLLKDKRMKRHKAKIGKIIFVVISPRVYGDGAVLQIVTVQPKIK